MGVRKVVSSTIKMLNPSTPTWKLTDTLPN